MNTKDLEIVSQLVQKWRSEDRVVTTKIDELRQWMREVRQLGIPHFGETATRLRQIRDQLVQHFQREEAMTSEVANIYPKSSPEVAAIPLAGPDIARRRGHIELAAWRL